MSVAVYNCLLLRGHQAHRDPLVAAWQRPLAVISALPSRHNGSFCSEWGWVWRGLVSGRPLLPTDGNYGRPVLGSAHYG